MRNSLYLVDLNSLTDIFKDIYQPLLKYTEIQSLLKQVDVSTDKNFQKKFTNFYRMKQRNKYFYEFYFTLFEFLKNKQPTFEYILTQIYENTGRVDPSAASKMLSSIDTGYPIWDKHLLEKLCLSQPRLYWKKEHRLTESIQIYIIIEERFEFMVNSLRGRKLINLFDEKFSFSGLTNIKKIEFILSNVKE